MRRPPCRRGAGARFRQKQKGRRERGGGGGAGKIARGKTGGILAELVVAAVAERAGLGMFAAAPRDFFGLGQVHLQRREAGAFVRAVAERLAFGFAARAPVEAAGLHVENVGKFLGNGWFTHVPVVTACRILAN